MVVVVVVVFLPPTHRLCAAAMPSVQIDRVPIYLATSVSATLR